MFISLEDPQGHEQIKNLLLSGGVIAIPTDTVWGLACLSDRPEAVDRIFQIKNRPLEATLPLFVSAPERIWDYSDADAMPCETVSRILDEFSPGPLTLVLPVRKGALGEHLVHPNGTAAFRVPDFPALRKMLEMLPAPLAATSLNSHGHQPVRGLRLVSRQFEPLVDAIAVHPLAPLNQRVSTVLGFEDDRPSVYRKGAVTLSQIKAALA